MAISSSVIRPKVSIIIAYYNKEATIERTLASIYAQDYENIEVIIVDDASNKGAKALLSRLASRHASLTLVHNLQNYGTLTTRIIGDSHARGEYLTYIDADDYYLGKDAISTMVEAMQMPHKPSYTIFGYYNAQLGRSFDYSYVDFGNEGGGGQPPSGSIVSYSNTFDNSNVLAPKIFTKSLLEQNKAGYLLWNKLYKRDLLLVADAILEPYIYTGLTRFEDVIKSYVINSLVIKEDGFASLIERDLYFYTFAKSAVLRQVSEINLKEEHKDCMRACEILRTLCYKEGLSHALFEAIEPELILHHLRAGFEAMRPSSRLEFRYYLKYLGINLSRGRVRSALLALKWLVS